MCLYPRLIKNRRYEKTKKNGGVIPPIPDKRVTMVSIGCENCIECRMQKAREWKVRLMEDIRRRTNGKFITLTFSDESIAELSDIEGKTRGLRGYELDNAIATVAMRRFLERWRKKYEKSLRHWAVTELGQNGTENIHIHAIVWTDEDAKEVARVWQYGHMFPNDWRENYVTERTVNYIAKYVSKVDRLHRGYKSKILTSPGIGQGYEITGAGRLNRFKGEKTREVYVTRQGIKLALPIYYRNKIYTEQEREKLWIQKLDKEERWVCGIRIRANDFERYIRTVKAARKDSEALGYGSNKISWDREKYERQMREILQETRIQRARKAMPAAWQLDNYANATLKRHASHDNKEWGSAPNPGFKQGDLDIWGKREEEEKEKNKNRIWEPGEYKWKDIWRIGDGELDL